MKKKPVKGKSRSGTKRPMSPEEILANPLAGIERPTAASLKKLTKTEWKRRISRWAGALKDDPTAGADMEKILRDRRHGIEP